MNRVVAGAGTSHAMEFARKVIVTDVAPGDRVWVKSGNASYCSTIVWIHSAEPHVHNYLFFLNPLRKFRDAFSKAAATTSDAPALQRVNSLCVCTHSKIR